MEAVKLFSALFLLMCFSSSSFGMVVYDQPMRWCTSSSQEESKCVAMKNAFANHSLSPSVVCIPGDSIPDCYNQIQGGRADLITLDGGDVYTAGKEYGLVPIIQEVYAKETYYGIAVVLANNTDISISNLRNKRSCHTGVRRTAGWNIPVGFLLDRGYMTATDCGDDINAVANFFSGSCAPGAFTSQNDPYGTNPAKLCSNCDLPNCPADSTEKYQSYAGAFRCLVEGAGDVAFIKPQTIMDNTDSQGTADWNRDLQSSQFRLLCPDDSKNTVENAASCNLAKGAAHAVMTSATASAEAITAFQAVLTQAVILFGNDSNNNGFTLFDSFDKWNGYDLLFKDTTLSLKNLTSGQTYKTYLGSYANTIDGLKKCPENTLRWCTTSSVETRKCRNMKNAFAGAGITPNISCYEESSASLCMDRIASDDADVVTVDGGDLYLGGRNNKVAPVAGEDYGYSDNDASYWAVAVARKGTSFGIDDLQQRKSCHTGIGKTSGWNVPIGHLINAGDIKVDDGCDVPMAVGTFFSGGSCAPGALSPAYNPLNTNPSSLCNLCIGEGQNHCVRNSNEPYEGYSGAFRCLAEQAGDVAFVKQSTVPDNTDTNGTENWNRNLRSQDYELLCPDGTRGQISDWRNCNLAKVPSHAVVTAYTKTDVERREIWNVLSQGQDRFKTDPGNSGMFGMFDSAGYTGSDLLFKDSTVVLVDVGNRNTYDKWLSDEYVKDLDALYCDTTGGTTSVAQISTILTVLVLILQAIWFAPVGWE